MDNQSVAEERLFYNTKRISIIPGLKLRRRANRPESVSEGLIKKERDRVRETEETPLFYSAAIVSWVGGPGVEAAGLWMDDREGLLRSSLTEQGKRKRVGHNVYACKKMSCTHRETVYKK